MMLEIRGPIDHFPGGVGGFLDKFRSAGLDSEVTSWLDRTDRAALTDQQVERALDSAVIGEIAHRVGLRRGDRAGGNPPSGCRRQCHHITPASTAMTAARTTMQEKTSQVWATWRHRANAAGKALTGRKKAGEPGWPSRTDARRSPLSSGQ
jgi:hypothetical protein